MMNKLLVLSVMAILAAGSAVVADDLTAPAWRGEAGSTYQKWSFSDDSANPAPDEVDNFYGMPLLGVSPAGAWADQAEGRQGVWPLSGEIDVYLPNSPQALPEKEIQVQVTWKPAELNDNAFLADEPIVGVRPYDLLSISYVDEPLADQWVHTTFTINMEPNPPEEWISIKGDILVDQLVIDTRCIPEPTTICLLGLGALSLLRRRRV